MRIAPVLILAAALPLAVAAQELKAGKYRVTASSDMAGEGAPSVEEECVTQKDIDEGLLKIGQDKDANCKVSDLKRMPGRISYKVSCVEDGRKRTGEVNATLGADSFDMKMVMAAPELPKPLTIRVAGKRLGNCQ